jgi:hypothetical protein
MRKMFVPQAGARVTLTLVATLALSCSADPGGASPPSIGPGDGMGGAAGGPATGVAGAPNPLGTAKCRPPAGLNGSPQTIEEAVALLNALPKPTSAACFVESLDRPLTAYASSSTFSAQPALSNKSPRVFLKVNRLWISVVVDGASSYLIEFSHLEPDDLRSIKGEVATPIAEVLVPSAPYDRVRYGTGTGCGLCHYGEEQASSVSFTQAFTSAAFRPRPETRVGLEALSREREACDWKLEPHRCEMLSALFDGGSVIEEPFPSSMPTFY